MSSNGFKLVQNLFKCVQMCSNLFIICSNVLKYVQMCSNMFKHVQTCYKLVKNLFKCYQMCPWVDQGSKGSRAVPAGSQGVKGYAFRFTGGEVVGLQVLNNIENYWPLLNAWTLLKTFEHYLRLLNKIEHLWVLLDWAILSCTWLYWAVLGGAGLYWVILGCTELYWAVLGRTGLFWAVQGCTILYWAVFFFSLIIFPVLSCCHEGWTFLATAQLAKQKHQQYWQYAHNSMSSVATMCFNTSHNFV